MKQPRAGGSEGDEEGVERGRETALSVEPDESGVHGLPPIRRLLSPFFKGPLQEQYVTHPAGDASQTAVRLTVDPGRPSSPPESNQEGGRMGERGEGVYWGERGWEQRGEVTRQHLPRHYSTRPSRAASSSSA